MQFNRAYTAPLCGPSRALILTGRYAFRTGATNQDSTGEMSLDEVMIQNALKPAGYVSSMVGKWSQLPKDSGQMGFDDYLQFKGSGVYYNNEKKAENYQVNSKTLTLKDKEYMPDLMHNHLIDFITKNKKKPFFVFYSLSHVHGDIQPTPDSKPDSKDLYADNIVYMDKLVGKLVSELERLKLRENTIIVFMGDNGTANKPAKRDTIGGKKVVGAKGSMEEGGSLVPLIFNWKGKIVPGKVTDQLIDASDLLPTFAELAGTKLTTKNVIDGQSFALQLLGKKGKQREWIFMQLANKWYVRSANWKLNQAGELFDMSNSPFEENLVAADTKDAKEIAARQRLQTVLAKLNPAGGILDDGDGTGRHKNKKTKKESKKEKPKN